MKGAGRSRRQAGFSLLEVLVAFAILSISLGVLMQIFSRASLSTVAANQYSRAASLVEARLAAVGGAIPLEPGAVSGEPEDGFEWEVGITPVELGLDGLGVTADSGLLSGEFGVEAPVTAYRVSATALWRDGPKVRRLTLSTLRVGERLDSLAAQP